MSKSITVHLGTKFSQEHNRRNERYTDKQEHIDKEKTKDNVVLVDKAIKKAYHEIFDEAVEDYNKKQKRNDRKIDDYYHKIETDKQKKVAYECIVQIGDYEDTGITSELEQKALLKYAEEWETRNPNLKIFGAYLHNDEGTSHLHIDYIPVAYNNSKGMSVQNSLSKALSEQGFTRGSHCHDTAQIAWERSERKAIERICLELGIDAKAEQKLTKREHLSVTEYKQMKTKMLSELEKELAEKKSEIDGIAKNIDALTDLDSKIKKTTFGNISGISKEEILSYNKTILELNDLVENKNKEIADLKNDNVRLQKKNKEFEKTIDSKANNKANKKIKQIQDDTNTKIKELQQQQLQLQQQLQAEQIENERLEKEKQNETDNLKYQILENDILRKIISEKTGVNEADIDEMIEQKQNDFDSILIN